MNLNFILHFFSFSQDMMKWLKGRYAKYEYHNAHSAFWQSLFLPNFLAFVKFAGMPSNQNVVAATKWLFYIIAMTVPFNAAKEKTRKRPRSNQP